MTSDEFTSTLNQDTPPEDLPASLRALWWDAKGNWKQAHHTAQDVHSPDGSWVHAYLHRKEGDEWNAGYWYGRAGRPHPKSSLNDEWQEIVTELLNSM